MVLFQGTEMGGIADVTPDELVVPEVVVFDCDICPVCNKDVEEGQQGIFCERCKTWYHHTCLKMTPRKFKQLQLTKEHWYCNKCPSDAYEDLCWGGYSGLASS